MINGMEKPIWFTSFSLNAAQKSYPILHLEAMAIVSTVKKFHKFLFGKKFIIYTDHKPLLGILGKNGKNSIFVTRLQRFVMELSIYDFDLIYRPSGRMGNADFCSRFPLNVEVPQKIDEQFIKSLNFSNELPVDFLVVASETKSDKYLKKIIFYLQNGWPDNVDKDLRNVYSQLKDLEYVNGCLLFQERVFIPEILQRKMLKLLHSNHVGVIKMKQLARKHVYWTGINSDIEKFSRNCEICSKMAVVHGTNKTYEWIPTSRPFSRIHTDFFYFERHNFLLIIDSYSKWLEIYLMNYGSDATKVLKKFSEFFSRFGLPDVIVSDNGPPYNSQQFVLFMEKHGIKVYKSPPYHPQSNGQAERLVRVAKEVLKKFLLDPDIRSRDIQDKLDYFLFNYRNSCLTKGEDFPTERIFKYRPKTLLDLVNPQNDYKKQLLTREPVKNNDKLVEGETQLGPSQYELEKSDPLTNLIRGDKVLYKNPNDRKIERWLNATFIKRISRNVFQIALGAHVVSAHRGQIRVQKTEPRRNVAFQSLEMGENVDEGERILPHASGPKRRREESEEEEEDFRGFSLSPTQPPPTRSELHPERILSPSAAGESCTSIPVVRKSSRRRKLLRQEDFVYF
ncbi:uncharacterized protein K02A2.6-like isoform X1 [Uranotaenia lowii]|uniref:uncharacterized protein K02A2.6-like isoform X1 n=1 Tax=Uranotaenia lowii TaxID=190385 RepID=UPI002478870C|nr:uncharacterized protein K02A2.6-like isoform X1 [Uranotaenia lowii]